MHLQFPLVLALAASALALPSTNQTGPALEKRFNKGWIGSFTDAHCATAPVGPRPEIPLHHCTPFTASPAYGYLGVYFGTGMYAFSSITVFSDSHCWDQADGIESVLNKTQFAEGGDFACLDYEQFGPFLSVETGSNN